MKVKCEKCIHCMAITSDNKKKKIHCDCDGFKDSSADFGYRAIDRPLLCSFFEIKELNKKKVEKEELNNESKL